MKGGEFMSFGDAVKIRLNELGMSQAELARRTGQSTAYVSMLINGNVEDPSFKIGMLFADALEIEPSELRKLAYKYNTSSICGQKRGPRFRRGLVSSIGY
jgi:transcriptional regulator with XRE-family HTH domain